MIKRLYNFENNFTLGKAALIIGFLTLLSRLVGFFRQFLLASNFGLGDTLDVYLTAFRIPDTIFNLLILGTLSAAFIPVFSDYLHKNKDHAFKIASSVINLAFLAVTAISILAFILARPLTEWITPGFSGAKLDLTVDLTRIMLVSPIIFTISNAFSSILSSFKKFIAVNVAGILYNIGIIFGLIYLYPKFGPAGLAFGVVLGAILHALIQIPELIRTGFRWKFILDLKDAGVKKIIKLFLPRIFGLDISVISLLVATFVGSLLAPGSIAAYNLANDLQAVPLGIFAFSTAIALFPVLSENFSKKEEFKFLQNLEKAIIQILIFIIPISLWILIFRAQIVRLIYGHGQIGWEQTIILFNALGVFCIALFSQSLTPLFARTFYSRQDTKTPVIIGIISMIINAFASYYLALSYGVIGMVGGFVIASFINVVLLFSILHMQLRKNNPLEHMQMFDRQLLLELSKIVCAAIIAGLISYAYLYIIEPYLNTRTTLGLFLQVSIAGSAGLVGYVIILYLTNNLFARQVLTKLKIINR